MKKKIKNMNINKVDDDAQKVKKSKGSSTILDALKNLSR